MTVKKALELIDNKLPDIKSSERLFIAGLMLDAYSEGYKESAEESLKVLESIGEEKYLANQENKMIEEEKHAKQVESYNDIIEEISKEDTDYEIASQRAGELI